MKEKEEEIHTHKKKDPFKFHPVDALFLLVFKQTLAFSDHQEKVRTFLFLPCKRTARTLLGYYPVFVSRM